MCLWSFITGRYTATAKVNDGRLVLSLPDAETPVVWIMELNDAVTSVLRLESDKQGFYVIKKHGGKTAETVAVYRNRRPAVRALNAATRALDRARSLRNNGGGRSRFTNALIVILFIWFALSRFWSLDQDLIRLALMPFFADDATVESSAIPTDLTQIPAPAAPLTSNTDAVGVPLSADDFLKSQKNKPAAGMLR